MSVANFLTNGNVLDTGGEVATPTFQTIALTGGAGTITFNSGANLLFESGYTNYEGAAGGPYIAAANTSINTPLAVPILASDLLLPVGGTFANPAAWVSAIAPPGTATGSGVTQALVDFPGGISVSYANQSGAATLPTAASGPVSVAVAATGTTQNSFIQVTPYVSSGSSLSGMSTPYVIPAVDGFTIKVDACPTATPVNVAWFVQKW